MVAAQTAEQLLVKLAAADNAVASARGKLKQAESEYDGVADLLFVLMQEQGTDQLRNAKAGLLVTIVKKDIPQVKDWGALTTFILRHKKLELFQRRLAAGVYDDLIVERKGKPIPGVEVYEKTRLHVTKSKQGE